MIDKPKVAAVYVRVSTGKQDAENQLLQLRPYCQKFGYIIGKEYMDIVSGAEDNRPAFNQLFKDAHQRKFDILVFWALDRFSRSGMAFTVQKLQELKNLGVDWDSFQEPYIKTIGPFGDVVMVLMATLARVERERLSERTKAGIARKRLTGWVPGRKTGIKDKKPRRRRGYYDNQNWAGQRKGYEKSGDKTPQIVGIGEGKLDKEWALTHPGQQPL
jgi:DNA invertase Pin-like site-specific DNA recombinase